MIEHLENTEVVVDVEEAKGKKGRKPRNDAWEFDEDELCKQVVIRYIERGVSQQAAFMEVGKLLGRTPGAVGFHFNNMIRPTIRAEISRAKDKYKKDVIKRKADKREKKRLEREASKGLSSQVSPTVEDISQPLETKEPVEAKPVPTMTPERYFKDLLKSMETLREDNRTLVHLLEKQREGEKELHDRIAALEETERDYLRLIDRARRMVVEEELEGTAVNSRKSFHMDKNGNLERDK